MSPIEPNGPDRDSSSATAPTAPTLFVGADRTFGVVVAIGTVIWLAVSIGLGWMARSTLDGAPIWQNDAISAADWRDAWDRIALTPFVAVVALGLLVLMGAAVLRRRGRPRASLQVSSDAMTLHHRLGTATRRVADIDLCSCGDLVAKRSDNDDGSMDVSIGTYLQLARSDDPKHAITVGCLTPNDLYQRWAGFTPGPDVRRWDLTLEPADFSALQATLSEGGMLTPTDDPDAERPSVRSRWSAMDLIVIYGFGAALVAAIVFAIIR